MERLKTLKVGSYIPAGTNPEEIVGKAKVLPYKAESRLHPETANLVINYQIVRCELG